MKEEGRKHSKAHDIKGALCATVQQTGEEKHTGSRTVGAEHLNVSSPWCTNNIQRSLITNKHFVLTLNN